VFVSWPLFPIGAGIEGGNAGSDWPLVLLLALVIGTLCYRAWQLSALAGRQLMAARRRAPDLP
jgi:hypothetical protein